MRDKPGKPRDFYHSCYALSGLSISQFCVVSDAIPIIQPNAKIDSNSDGGGVERRCTNTSSIGSKEHYNNVKSSREDNHNFEGRLGSIKGAFNEWTGIQVSRSS